MIAMFSLFIPPLFLVLVRRRVFGGETGSYGAVISYIFSVLGLNWSMMLILYCFFDSTGDLFSRLGTYSGFACKYILLAMVLAGIEPYVERFFRKDLELHISVDKSFGTQTFLRYLRPCAVIYTILLFILNFIRIFDDNFWFDEAVTLSQMDGSFAEITAWAARDVHPPLYYYMLKTVHMLFDGQGWAYHLLSLIPFLVICILSLTVFWKDFGGKVSLILVTLAGLSGNAVTYNMEVRMYSWASLFVLLSFYGVWRILKRQRGWDHIFFAMVSLGAAYTHYFAMVSVAFFYLALMFVAVFLKRLHVKAVVVTWIGTIIGYVPWVVAFLKTVLRTAAVDGFWVTSSPSFKEVLGYLFSMRFADKAAWMVLSVAIILFFLYGSKILTITSKNGGGYQVAFSLTLPQVSEISIWVASGIFCIVGTALFGIIYSHVIRPVFTLKYIYATSIVAWMILANVVSGLKWGKIWTVILWIYLLMGFIPRYQDIYMSEKQNDDVLQTTLEVMEEIDADDVILAEQRHLVGVVKYYHPDNEVREIELDRSLELDGDKCYYLLMMRDKEMQSTIDYLDGQGFDCVRIMEAGHMGFFNFDIYRIEKRGDGSVNGSQVLTSSGSPSFYQKLQERSGDVDILIVGDSISSQGWPSQLASELEKDHSVSVDVTNVSMGGNSSYAGYVRLMALDHGAGEEGAPSATDYDLIIFCYGQNDRVDGFGCAYEGMIRAARSKYPQASMISILESPQREYTEKMEVIQELAEHYGILVADVIAPFMDGSYGPYDTLTVDGVHPNERGEEVYIKTVLDVIDRAVERGQGALVGDVEPVYDGTEAFDHFVWFEKEMFTRNGNTFMLDLEEDVSGTLGIYHCYLPGKNSYKISADGVMIATAEFEWKYNFKQEHIDEAADNCTVDSMIEITFGNAEQADGFCGICFNGG